MKHLRDLISLADKHFPLWLQVVALGSSLIASAVAAFKFLVADVPQLTELFKVIAWPTVVCIGLLVFRVPIGQFLAGIANRVKKISAFKVEIELAEAKA